MRHTVVTARPSRQVVHGEGDALLGEFVLHDALDGPPVPAGKLGADAGHVHAGPALPGEGAGAPESASTF